MPIPTLKTLNIVSNVLPISSAWAPVRSKGFVILANASLNFFNPSIFVGNIFLKASCTISDKFATEVNMLISPFHILSNTPAFLRLSIDLLRSRALLATTLPICSDTAVHLATAVGKSPIISSAVFAHPD